MYYNWFLTTVKELFQDNSLILKIKRDVDGNPHTFKARFVAGGHKQTTDEYGQTYAPVAKTLSMFTLLTLAMRKNLLVHHVDFDAAFLNAPLKEVIYMNQIKGFEDDDTNSIYKLNKTL